MSRLLHEDEVSKLIPLGRLFFAESGSAGEFNPPHFASAWASSIAARTGFVLVNECDGSVVAALGAAIWRCPLTGDTISAENFYYSLPNHRTAANIRLLRDYEQVAKARGAKRVWMVHLKNEAGERIGDLYTRRGYKPRESLYEKIL